VAHPQRHGGQQRVRPYPHGGLFQFYALDKETRIPADAMNLVIPETFQGTTSDPPGPASFAHAPRLMPQESGAHAHGWGGGINDGDSV
jgi:hypothetical protein